jgi:hypothetical protein
MNRPRSADLQSAARNVRVMGIMQFQWNWTLPMNPPRTADVPSAAQNMRFIGMMHGR